KTAVTIKVTPSTITKAQQITVSGTVKPFVSGDVGFIQRFNGAKWIDLTTAVISRTGTYSRSFTTQATTTYRLYVPRHGLNAAGYSPDGKVTFPTGPQAPVITTTTMPDGFTETAYSKTLTKTGDAGTWAVTGGSLPPGLSLNSSTGVVSGTPTTGGTYSFTVTFSQTGNLLSDSQPLSIKILVKPKITTTSLPAATAYVSYSQQLAVTGQAGTWSVSSGTLPTGITLNSSTGVLSGKPTVAGSYPLTFAYTETTSGLVGTKSLPLTVNVAPDPVITTTSLPNATAYSTYSTSVAKTGNAGTWAITSGSLPAGISFNTSTGALSGKPTVSGDFPLTFKFTEIESGTFASKSLPLHVNPAPDPVITTTSLPNATAYSNYSTQLVRTGNAGTWSLMSGTLPTGLSLDGATGIISGKPTVAGDYPLTFKFTETESGTFDTKSLPLHVNPAPNPVINTTVLPDGQAFQDYSTTLSKTGNAGTWSITSGTLPSGITFDTSTGVLSGRPTVSGDFPLTFKFTETESGTFASKALSLHLTPAPDPVITSTSPLPSVLINANYSAQLTKTGNAGTWSITAGALPGGLTLDTDTGLISGAPTASGTFNFTVRFTETESGTFDSKAFSLLVYSRPTITTVGLPDAVNGNNYTSTTLTKTGGSGTGTWTLASGTLPNGLALSAAGAITGKATVNGDFSFTVRFSDSVTGATTTKALTIHVGPIGITTGQVPDGTKGSAYSVQFAGSPDSLLGGAWSLVSGSLPTGITFTNNGLLSGTPTVSGDFTFTVSYTVLLVGTRTRTYTLHINP
ncbi:MAG: putative Ig domain-containing protein, partial [Marmoricola sp.]